MNGAEGALSSVHGSLQKKDCLLCVFLNRCVPPCPLLHYLNGLKVTSSFVHQKTKLFFILLETKYARL